MSANVMRKQNKCYGLGNPSLILFRHSSLQNLDAERNHMHYVPFAAAGVSVAVSLRRHDGNVGVVEPMMRRRAWICAGSRRRICSPEIAQLPVNVAMRRVMKRSRIISALLVPAFDLVGNDGSFFQGKSIQQRTDLCGCRFVGQSFVGDRADNLMSKRGVRLRPRKLESSKNYRQEQRSRKTFHSENAR